MKREAIKKWVWEHMHESIADTIKALNVKMIGHYRYYGVYGNYIDCRSIINMCGKSYGKARDAETRLTG